MRELITPDNLDLANRAWWYFHNDEHHFTAHPSRATAPRPAEIPLSVESPGIDCPGCSTEYSAGSDCLFCKALGAIE